ncbi:phage integrase central domain-containing protein, partial [Leptospira sp. SA-E8]|uniref:phage integrase central domain-containing protein n=1 Tax=Leptospira sp. SA-E8 TaxID=3422259 RepID=UPI003EBE97CF
MLFFSQQACNDALYANDAHKSTGFAPESTNADHDFAVYAEQVYANETARVARKELSRDSLLILRNRLDKHILPHFGAQPIAGIDYPALLEFIQLLSRDKSTITVSQYLVILRKVFAHAQRMKAIAAMPELPTVKITTTPRGAFTPSEYWRIMRTARRLRGQAHPLPPRELRLHCKLRDVDRFMPPDLAWA